MKFKKLRIRKDYLDLSNEKRIKKIIEKNKKKRRKAMKKCMPLP